MRIAPEGWVILGPWLLVMAAAGAGAWWLGGWWASPVMLAALLLAGWGVWFFRDPERVSPADPDAVISPADGVVVKIDRAVPPPEVASALAAAEGAADPAERAGPEPRERVAIFLSLLNVHVNRTPIGGTVVATGHVPGQFLKASLDKSSELNERSSAVVVDGRGRAVVFVQIAGMIAKRIVNHLRPGQRVAAGERFGLIRFGSRAEIYFPRGSLVAVRQGDRVSAGISVLGRLPAPASVEAGSHQAAGAAAGGSR